MLVESPMNIGTVSILAFFAAHAATCTQSAFFNQWQAHALQTRPVQSGWSVPLIAEYPSLIQVTHTSIAMQIAAAREGAA